MSLFNKKESKLSNYLDGYKKTNKSLAVKITELLGGYSANNDDIYEELLVLLISSDISVDNAEKIMDQLKERVNEQFVKNPKTISYMLADILKENYKDYQKLSIEKDKNKLIMMVGVNGSGKTTTISKLANYYIKHGFTVGLIGADTFRAGAVSQLEAWAQKLNVKCISGKEKADPSSVLVDGIRYFNDNPVDIIIADTAGRLQNKNNLMNELKKMVKVTTRELNGRDLDIYLTIDATTGQNGLSQAEAFIEGAKVNAVILTKMDGTSKGGIVLSINDKYNLPVKFITYGEQIDDICQFDINQYIDGNQMEKFDYINQLLPFYIELLTKKQQEVMTLYYYDNYSLSEIAQQLEISRNGVYDSLKKSEELIEKYESLLHLSTNCNKRMHYYTLLQSLENKQVNDIVKELIDLED